MLKILKKLNLQGWYILTGMIGFFILAMLFARDLITMPLAQLVAAIAGIFGNMTGFFEPYFKYGILFIHLIEKGSMTIQIDFECSGVIEIIVYLSIISFFLVYKPIERFFYGIFGCVYIILANALRIIIICTMIHFGGVQVYGLAHTYIGRLLFYFLTVILYYFVLTKKQVSKMKLGNFGYNVEKD